MKMQDALQHPVFKIIAQAAQNINQETYVVGGFVRDFLLEKNKQKDIDFVTIGSGIKLANEAAKITKNNPKVTVFKRYGTAMFRWEGLDLEFVGARKESYQKDSRNPIVEDGSLIDDQNRRDFTINALAISLNPNNYAQLLDPFNGLIDLHHNTIKTPLDPNITFSDDPLRMMRAVRFAAQLQFSIDENCFESIKNQAQRLNIVSKERTMDEFNKIMQTPRPSVGLKLLHQANLLNLILPELTALQGIDEVEGQTHKDNFYHTLEVVDNIAQNTNDLWLRWAALLHDIGKAPTKRFNAKVGWTFHSHEFVGAKMIPKIFRRLKLPLNEPLKYVSKLVQLSSRPIALISEEATDSALRRLLFDAGDDFDDLMTLCKADITTKSQYKRNRYQENFDLVQKKMQILEERDRVRNFQPPISGEEIMQTFGITPCKEVGVIKNAIKEAILEGEIPNNKEAAKQLMQQLGKRYIKIKKDT